MKKIKRGTMRILVIADIDDLHWKYGHGSADVLLSCGDVYDQVIQEAAEAYNCQTIFAVKGNHDRSSPFAEPIIDLHLQTIKLGGFTFGGLNGACKYKPRGNFQYCQREVENLSSTLSMADIFLSHNSPRGIHDQEDEAHLGFEGLNSYIKRVCPKLLFHGHQHVDRETSIGETTVIGIYRYKVICV